MGTSHRPCTVLKPRPHEGNTFQRFLNGPLQVRVLVKRGCLPPSTAHAFPSTAHALAALKRAPFRLRGALKLWLTPSLLLL